MARSKLDTEQLDHNVLDHADTAAVYSGGPTSYDSLYRNTGGQWAVRRDTVSTVDPTASNDSTQGYAIGSTWLNTTNNSRFICFSATATAAVWLVTTNGLIRSLSKTIQLGFGDNSQSYVSRNSVTWFSAGEFPFLGTNTFTPSTIKLTVSRNGATGVAEARILRLDTAQIVASLSWTTEPIQIITTTTINNLPATERVFQIQIRKQATNHNEARLHHMFME